MSLSSYFGTAQLSKGYAAHNARKILVKDFTIGFKP